MYDVNSREAMLLDIMLDEKAKLKKSFDLKFDLIVKGVPGVKITDEEIAANEFFSKQ